MNQPLSPEPTPSPRPSPWRWAWRLPYRFLFIYLVLYCVEVPLGIASSVAGSARSQWMEDKENTTYKDYVVKKYRYKQEGKDLAELDSDPNLTWREKYADPVFDAIFKTSTWYYDLGAELVPWVGKTVFDIDVPVRRQRGGSGDGIFRYMTCFTWACLAAGVAVTWTLLEIGWAYLLRPLGDRLAARFAVFGYLGRFIAYFGSHEFLRFVIRYSLAYWMIVYGAMKVIKTQFAYPSIHRLTETFGEASPMGLLWAFMGHSQGYNFFAGMGEMVGGLLLTTRRTTLLGELISFGVMLHVAVLNLCYDVPVKLFSLHLVFMAFVLIAPDAVRLSKFFIFNRPVEPKPQPSILRRWPWAYVALILLRTTLVGLFVWYSLEVNLGQRKRFGDLKERPPLYGHYHVQEFLVDGKLVSLPTTDRERWLKFTIESSFAPPGQPQPIAATIYGPPRTVFFRDYGNPRQGADPSTMQYRAKIDPEKRTLTLNDFQGNARGEFTYTVTDPEPEPPPVEPETRPNMPPRAVPTWFRSGKLILEGKMNGKALKVVMQRVDDSYLLMRPEYSFRWIQENPFNR